MTAGSSWGSHCAQQLVRYEALFKLLDDIQKTEDILVISRRVSKQWKYFSNVSVWRLIIRGEQGYHVIEGFRGDAVLFCCEDPPEWDERFWNLTRPHLFSPENLPDDVSLPQPFDGKAITEIKVMPIDRSEQRIALLTVAARHAPFNDLDVRFIQLFGGYFIDRVAGILLRETAIRSLTDKATYDFLTGLYNRGVVIDRLENNIAHSLRLNSPLCVMIADIDYFKTVNDTYGHLVGDRVLKEIAKRFQYTVRSGEIVGRYGGEEFLFVLYPCSLDQAESAAERFCNIVRDVPVSVGSGDQSKIEITMSIGVACTDGILKVSLQSLLKKRTALYIVQKPPVGTAFVWMSRKSRLA